MSKEEKENLKQMIYDYGAIDVVESVINILREQADEQSDMGLKDQAIESRELADFFAYKFYK